MKNRMKQTNTCKFNKRIKIGGKTATLADCKIPKEHSGLTGGGSQNRNRNRNQGG